MDYGRSSGRARNSDGVPVVHEFIADSVGESRVPWLSWMWTARCIRGMLDLALLGGLANGGSVLRADWTG